MTLPVQSAVWSARAEGEPSPAIVAQASAIGSYRPPVLMSPLLSPPQTIIWLPVQTAEWRWRAAGAPTRVIGVQMSLAGSYLYPEARGAPVEDFPPQTIMSDPVQTAVN